MTTGFVAAYVRPFSYALAVPTPPWVESQQTAELYSIFAVSDRPPYVVSLVLVVATKNRKPIIDRFLEQIFDYRAKGKVKVDIRLAWSLKSPRTKPKVTSSKTKGISGQQ